MGYLMDEDIVSLQRLIDKITLNIAEQEARNALQGNRAYAEIYEDISRTVDYAASAHKGQRRLTGEPYIFHPLNVALISAENGMVDKISIDSCILHDVIEDGNRSSTEISEIFGSEVAETVDGLTKIKTHKGASYDKFFSHTLNNPRVAYLKIFDRLHNLRTLEPLEHQKQIDKSNESMDIYYKLCMRLCLTDIANEIEQLCAPVLYPDKYILFKERLDKIRQEATQIMDTFKMNILDKCHGNDVKLKKIRVLWKPFLDVGDYDFMQIPHVLLFKLVVDSIENVYKMLWLINSAYKVASGIEDYISVPKFNNFRGINYTVIAKGVRLPLLITTDRFNEFNRKGILAYGGFSKDTTINRKLMKHLQEYLSDESNFMDVKTLISFIEKDDIQVFAKDGKTIVDLQKGATVLDFAFKIHTDIGLKAEYGVVDGVRVGLRHELQNGNVVHVHTKHAIAPTEELLKMCITPKAQRVLKKYFETMQFQALLDIAKSYLERNLFRFNINAADFWEKLREKYPSEREAMAKVVNLLQAAPETERLLAELALIDEERVTLLRKKEDSFLKVWNVFHSHQKVLPIELDFLNTNYQSCPHCIPTLNNAPHKGILEKMRFTVHTHTCDKVKDFEKERFFFVKFRKDKPIDDMVYMNIESDDVSGMTHAISSVFKKVNLEIFNVDNDHVKAFFRLAYYQKSPQKVSSYLEQLHKIPEVRSIIISTKNIFGMHHE
jgi:GTP diphosphokinase / guanosine-3',5'-bis(diphosphate) 3'-diphosphatase